MWDKRYDREDYAFGVEPNDFLKEKIKHIPKGRILSIGEGEGRNAVYLAENGYQVTAIDYSSVGLRKAEKLAHKRGVPIECIHGDVEYYEIEEDRWDAIISIYCHLSPEHRSKIYNSIIKGLKSGGVFLLEGYSTDQLKFATGGPKSEKFLLSTEIIKASFSELETIHFENLERNVIEGMLHTGRAAVIQYIGRKL